MLATRHFISLALQALLRNRIQTLLAMLGVMVGVGALITSISLGRGAQQSIQEQLLAAGVNMIMVTAGNYQTGRSQRSGASPTDHGSIARPERLNRTVARGDHGGRPLSPTLLRPAVWHGDEAITAVPGAPRLRHAHYEDDPMALHDHPTAKERLGDSMAGLGAAATLTIEDARAIQRDIPGVKHVASGVHENARVALPDEEETRQWFTRLHGTEADLPLIRHGWTFPHGSFLQAAHLEGSEQVMVLGRVVADRLFGENVNPVGRSVLLWNQPFEVIGVVGSRSWASQPSPGDDQFDAVYVPVTTVHRLLNLSKLNTVTVTTESVGDTTRIADEITTLLRRRHGITDQMPDDFTVETQAQQVLSDSVPPDMAKIVTGNLGRMDEMTIAQLSASMERANGTMLALLAGVATVSLVVGGIGVMNLLLLSVSQRTREVGLRMALGARRRDIAVQFVIEAVLLSVIGGLLGAVLALLASASLEEVFQWTTVISPATVVLAIAVAALLGVVSGGYPARRAAELEPIGALHHE